MNIIQMQFHFILPYFLNLSSGIQKIKNVFFPFFISKSMSTVHQTKANEGKKNRLASLLHIFEVASKFLMLSVSLACSSGRTKGSASVPIESIESDSWADRFEAKHA